MPNRSWIMCMLGVVVSLPLLASDFSSGLIAHYRLDGDGQDSSGAGRHGQVFGTTPTTDRHSASGRALEFDGDGDYVWLATHAVALQPAELTIGAWFRADSGESGLVSSIVRSRLYGYYLSISESDSLDAAVFVDGGNEFVQVSGGNFRDDQWHHATLSWNGIELVLWVDGVLFETATAVASGPIHYEEAAVAIGRDGDAGWYFVGAIDEVRFYDRELDDDERLGLYHELLIDGWETGDFSAWSSITP